MDKTKVFAFDGVYVKYGIGLYIFNDNDKRYTLNRYVGKYEKTFKRVLETNNLKVIIDYIEQLKLCNVPYHWNYIKVTNGIPTKKNGHWLPKIKVK
jgi:hypothetical protein